MLDMSTWLIVLTGYIYLAVGVEQYINGNMGMALMFAAYALANVGIWMQAR